jgi:3alpha(or 20beta)-hydroxysteroid dehydrogenase
LGTLDGKVAIITGAARGQGEAHAKAFVEAGASIVIGDVLDDACKEVANALGEAATHVRLDVTSEDHWRDAVQTAVDRYGALTTLVNNAGVSPRPTPILDTTVEQYRQVIDVNQVGIYIGMRTAAPVLAQAEGASIVNVSSVNGFQGGWGIAGYASSKFAVRGLTRTAAIEWGELGIRVNSIHPGPIDTYMISAEAWGGYDPRPAIAKRLPLERVGRTDEVSELVVWLASDASSFCTGSEFVVDGGFLAGPPRLGKG